MKATKHSVVYPDASQKVFDNLGHHIRIGIRNLNPLKKGQSIEVPVMAHQYHNRTGILLEKGLSYSFKVKPNQIWKDGVIECTADGWTRDNVEIGWIKVLAVKTMEPFKR